MKTRHFNFLPHLLIRLAALVPAIVEAAANEALRQYRLNPDIQHRLAHLFCSMDGFGPYLEALAEGVLLSSPMLDGIFGPEWASLFRAWVARFRFIPVVERSIEGKHALMAIALRRSPNVSAAFLSLQLRLSWLMARLKREPELLQVLQQIFSRYRSYTEIAILALALLNLNRKHRICIRKIFLLYDLDCNSNSS